MFKHRAAVLGNGLCRLRFVVESLLLQMLPQGGRIFWVPCHH